MLECNDNIQEKKDYTVYLKTNFFKNNLYYAVNSVRISNSGILGGCLYTNTDNTWENLTIKLVSAISNHKKKISNYDVNTLIPTYKKTLIALFFE